MVLPHRPRSSSDEGSLADDLDKWIQHIEYGLKMPEPREYKSTIMMWMGHWPFSLLWTLLNDPIVKICRWLYTYINTFLQRIAERIYRDAQDDLKKSNSTKNPHQ